MLSVNVAGRTNDSTIEGMISRCSHVHRVGSLDALRALLESLDGLSGEPRHLDLIGHSTRPARLLRMDETVIDMFDPKVARFFVQVARDELMQRANLVSVRLLGCSTASQLAGQRTMSRLARTLRLPVFGTNRQLMKSHYNNAGFDPTFGTCLVEATG